MLQMNVVLMFNFILKSRDVEKVTSADLQGS